MNESGDGQFDAPYGLALSSSAEVFVFDCSNHHICSVALRQSKEVGMGNSTILMLSLCL